MNRKKKVIIIITILLFVSIYLISTGFSIEYIFAEAIYRRENSIDSKIFFSRKSGFYDEEFYLSIYAPSDEVYYTLDGSEPTKESLRYVESLYIYDASRNENTYSMRTDFSAEFTKNNSMYAVPDYLIDKCTILKVAYYDKDGQRSETEERVYFVGYGEKSGYNDVNIISITTDPENLFSSDRGIYVMGDNFKEYAETTDYQGIREYLWAANYKNSGREWEREAKIQIFDQKKELVLCQTVGLRIQGE